MTKSLLILISLFGFGAIEAGTINHLDRISVGEFEEVMANSRLYQHLNKLKGQRKTQADLAMRVLQIELLYKINENLKRLNSSCHTK